jgi:hypothetical protein
LELGHPLDGTTHDFNNQAGSAFDAKKVVRVLVSPSSCEVRFNMDVCLENIISGNLSGMKGNDL